MPPTGEYRHTRADSTLISRIHWRSVLTRDRLLARPVLEAVQKLKPIAAEANLSLAQFALAWVLREPNVASAIIGASRPGQVSENAAASDAVVDPALFAEAERILAEALSPAVA